MLTKKRKNITAENAEGAEGKADSSKYGSYQDLIKSVFNNYASLENEYSHLLETGNATQTAQNTGEQTQTPPVDYSAQRPTQVISNEGGMIPNENPQDTQDRGSSGSAASEADIKNATEAISKIEITDADYKTYAEEIKNAGVGNDKIRRDFVVSVHKLKDKFEKIKKDIENKYGKLNREQKDKLVHSITKKLTELSKGKIGYKPGSFLFKGDTFVGPKNHVCSQFIALIAYITGNSKSGAHEGWPLNKAVNKNYESGYLKAWDKAEKELAKLKQQGLISQEDKLAAPFWGVSNMAYNRDIMKPTEPNIGKNKLVNMMQNKDVKALKKLQGKVLMIKENKYDRVPYAKDVKVGNKTFKFYNHTVMIGPYDSNTGKLTIYESTTGGTRSRQIPIEEIKSQYKHFDIYEFQK